MLPVRRHVLSAVLTCAVLAGCGGAAEEGSADTAASAQPSAPSTVAPDGGASAAVAAPTGPATLATIEVEQYGRLLVDGDDLTLYVFLSDTDGRSTCYEACADNWPPVLTDGDAEAGGRIDDALLGTVERDDGTVQVTYDDQPLYRYSGDSSRGDILGYGSGDVWYPVAPDGSPIDTAEDRANDDGY